MAKIMNAPGKMGDLGRGNQDAKNSAGNSGLRTPSGTSDFRDPVDNNSTIVAVRLTPPVKSGRGGHDKSKMGG